MSRVCLCLRRRSKFGGKVDEAALARFIRDELRHALLGKIVHPVITLEAVKEALEKFSLFQVKNVRVNPDNKSEILYDLILPHVAVEVTI